MDECRPHLIRTQLGDNRKTLYYILKTDICNVHMYQYCDLGQAIQTSVVGWVEEDADDNGASVGGFSQAASSVSPVIGCFCQTAPSLRGAPSAPFFAPSFGLAPSNPSFYPLFPSFCPSFGVFLNGSDLGSIFWTPKKVTLD